MTNTTSARNPTSVPITEVLAERWSPRGFDVDHTVAREDLVALFEAARWAASGANGQPWKFIAAARGTAEYAAVDAAQAPWNTAWAGRGSAYGVVLVNVADGESTLDAASQRSRFYDVGMSVANLALEAENRGLHIHQVAGSDEAALREAFAIGDDFEIAAVFILGRLAAPEAVPAELRESDGAPRQRRTLDEIVTLHV